MDTFEHIVKQGEEGFRLDKLLVALNESYSRHQLQALIKGGNVTVNGRIVKANYPCKLGDLVVWNIPEEKEYSIDPEPLPLSIVYEDDFLLVIHKPAGMLVHPTQTVQTGTLVNALKHHTKKLSDLSGGNRPGIVHRLDQYTSGLLVVAKDNATHEHLKNQFKDQTVTRIYEAVVFGVMQHNSGVIQAPIGRDPKNRLRMAVVANGKQAETRFRVLERFSQYTHVECQLITGRTHQIRVHLKYIQHPIVGDETYCKKKTNLLPHQALFAKKLGFIHPKTDEEMMFTAETPELFKNLLQTLHKRT